VLNFTDRPGIHVQSDVAPQVNGSCQIRAGRKVHRPATLGGSRIDGPGNRVGTLRLSIWRRAKIEDVEVGRQWVSFVPSPDL